MEWERLHRFVIMNGWGLQNFLQWAKSVGRRFRRRPILSLTLLAALACAGAAVATWGASAWIGVRAAGRVYSDLEKLPYNDVALVLGTSRQTSQGRQNIHFAYRIEAAARLYRTGKVKHILASGDNHRQGYDEPSDMKEALIEHGVPPEAITLDYAGFRTLDSVVRARRVFGLQSCTIVSQGYHNDRAVFLARSHGLDAVAWCAQSPPRRYSTKTEIREYLARVKAALDIYLLRTGPRYLGPREDIQLG